MLTMHEQLEVHDLIDAGLSVADIAARTEKSLGTIYKYKQLGRQLQGKISDQINDTPVDLVPYESLVIYHIKRRKLRSADVFTILQQAGYKGSYRQFEHFYKQRKQTSRASIGYLKHPEPGEGEQAQVDWAHFGQIEVNGKREKVYLFSYVLSWSRMMYLEFVVRQNQLTLQICHRHAFEKLGMPKTIVYDNMKTVVSHRERLPNRKSKPVFNADFLRFASYYQFEPRATGAYYPQAKGKVEAAIGYVRNHFVRLTPRVSVTLEEINKRVSEWVEQEANNRQHGTTKERPYDRWLREKPFLKIPNNLPPYNASPFKTYYTTQWGLLIINGITYNLGTDYARLKLEVRERQKHGLPLLEIYRQNKPLITTYVPSDRTWVPLYEELAKLHKPDSVQAPEPSIKKKVYSFDIDVEKRDLGYYSLNLTSREEDRNG